MYVSIFVSSKLENGKMLIGNLGIDKPGVNFLLYSTSIYNTPTPLMNLYIIYI